ncbi:SHOCT domain-containing protein [Chloroflexota bacterium]
MPRGRRTARRTSRRRTRRRVHRRHRRRRRRRVLVGGMVLLAVGGAAYGAIKLSQKDSDRIEEHSGSSVEEMTEEELVAAMKELGIQSIELSDEDKAAMAAESGDTEAAGAPAEPEPSYIDELEQLAALRDQGAITEEDFEAKKAQLLGL